MASAATASSSAIDIKSQATYPIRLGNSIAKAAHKSPFTSMKYNYRPTLKSLGSVEAVIRAGEEAGESKLSIDIGDGEFSYSGRHSHSGDNFVLVVRGRGKDKEVVLERMGSSHGFNLTSTPSESDAAKLANRYPPVVDDADDDDLFGDDGEDAPPDEDNPFDYRHFLKAELDKLETTNANLDATRSTATSPVILKRPPTSAPTTKPVKRTETKPPPQKKRKTPAAPEKPNPKRVKAGHEQPAPAPKPKAKPDVPKIAVDRKASLRRSSWDDSGELILENETPVSEKPPKHLHAMSLALNGQLGSGPISLRSAANSPGSCLASPAPEAVEEEYVFEFDDEPEPEEEEDPEDDEVDADVDDLELPSPAQTHRQSASLPVAGDDDDDLDKQLERAMREANQESEESEEE